jgi:ABC-type nitrate/sulfonate/bicarbonate transport system substrate-binding protein
VQAGRPVSIIACDISGSSSAGIIVKADSRYQSLQDLSGQRVGVIGASGAAFGSAAAYSNYIKQRGGQALSLVVEPNAAAIGAALSSGLVAAAVGQISAHRSAISAGKSRILLEPTSQLTKSIVGSDVCAGAWYGLKSSLNSDPQRREAIRRFVAGLRIAVAAIIKASDAEVAAVLGKSPDFSPSVVSRSDLESQIADSRPFFAQHDGFISPQVWSTSLKAFSTWGLSLGGIDVDVFGPPFTYNSIVDMSYWNAASALVAEHK